MALPTSTRVPFFSIKVDPSNASQGPALLQYRALMIGQRTSDGAIAELVKKKISNETQARLWWGEGSQMHLMARAWFANNRHIPLDGIALNDANTGVMATKTITVAFVSEGATIEATSTIAAYVGGKRVPVVLQAGDDEDDIAEAIYQALSDTEDLPMTFADPGANIVTGTARNAGVEGNAIDIRFNEAEDEEMPIGLTVTVAAGVSGANNPLLSSVITMLGDEWYQVIIAPYTDTTNLQAIETELASRADEVRQIPGQYITARTVSDLATLETFGQSRNSAHVQCFDSFGIPWTSFELAAAVASAEAASASADPAKPQFRQTIYGLGARHPALEDRRTFEEQNNLLHAGISIIGYGPGGTIQIGRAITMYQKNDAGATDTAHLRAETMFTHMYIRYSHRNLFMTKYSRAKLAGDGAVVPSGQQYLTPSIAKAETVALARQWEALGLVENVDQFKEDLVVERDISDPDRLNFNLQPDYVNQFVVGAVNLQFKL